MFAVENMIFTRPGGICVTIHLENPSRNASLFCGNDAALMQFTGLKDRDGRKIYEGDLMANDWISPKGLHFEVYWKDDGRWDLRNTQGWRYWERYGGPINWDYMEAIGNIYENPELLEHPS